jgi:DNA-binding NarL/FixJ family response regulator
MNRQEIMIADRDIRYRIGVADFFRKAGHRVVTTDSAQTVLNCALAKQACVLLLGSDFGKGVSMADLIHLLKTFNCRMKIIMVSDELTLAQARRVRAEGIFYHALKPTAPGDLKELGEAVNCAFATLLASQAGSTAAAPGARPATGNAWSARKLSFKELLPGMVVALAVIIVASYLLRSSPQPPQGASRLATWIFLGFCALVLVGQLLPIFRIKLVLICRHAWHTARATLHRGGW